MPKNTNPSEQQIVHRRDAAVRRALNTPPKSLDDMKKDLKVKRQAKATASAKKP